MLTYSTVGCRRTARLDYQDFLRTCQARNLKIRTGWIIVCEMCADLALRTTLKRAALIADKNVNQLEKTKNGAMATTLDPTFYSTRQSSSSLLCRLPRRFYCMCKRGFGSPRIWIPHPKTLADLDPPRIWIPPFTLYAIASRMMTSNFGSQIRGHLSADLAPRPRGFRSRFPKNRRRSLPTSTSRSLAHSD